METVDLDAVEIPKDVLSMIPADRAQRYHMIPLRFEKDTETLVVAMAHPDDLGALEDLRFRHDCDLKVVAADRPAVDAAIRRCYGSNVEQMIDEMIAQCESYRPFTMKAVRCRIRHAYHAMAARVWGVFPSRLSGKAGESHRRWELAVSVPFVKLTNILILMAIQEGASGMVIALSKEGGKVSFRDEKGLREIRSLSPKVARLVMRRLRRMAEMKPHAQEGRFSVLMKEEPFECRVKCETREDGEHLCLQIAKGAAEPPG